MPSHLAGILGAFEGSEPNRLPGGLRSMIGGLGVFLSRRLAYAQRVGIHVDVEVHPTIAGIRAGREVLESAVHRIVPEVPSSEVEKLARPDRTVSQPRPGHASVLPSPPAASIVCAGILVHIHPSSFRRAT
jgi:hypothetical protein